MCSTLSPITAASVCFIPLTSGRPACKQNGGQSREGSERSISRSPKDTMSWDQSLRSGNSSLLFWQCQQLFPAATGDLLLPARYSTEWVACKEDAFIPHSLEAEGSKVKRPHVLRTLLLMESQRGTGCHLTWQRKLASLKFFFLYSWSWLRSHSLRPEDLIYPSTLILISTTCNTIDMTYRRVPIGGLPASDSYTLAFTCNALSCQHGKSKGMAGWWPVL